MITFDIETLSLKEQIHIGDMATYMDVFYSDESE